MEYLYSENGGNMKTKKEALLSLFNLFDKLEFVSITTA